MSKRTATTPRYVLPSHGSNIFEFPIVAEFTKTPACVLSVAANDFRTALVKALAWCAQYSEKHDGRYFPRIAVPHADGVSLMLAKRIESKPYVWVENNQRGQWVPVEKLGRV